MKIGYLGPAGTFSWKAAEIFCRIAQVNTKLIPFETFEKGMAMLEQGEVDRAVFPIETSGGWMTKVLGLIEEVPHVEVETGTELLTQFHLLVQRGTEKQEINTLCSKAEALSQCSKYIRQMGGVQCVSVGSTAEAAKLADVSIGVAAIGPLWMTDNYFSSNLTSLEKIKDGMTRFLVLKNGKGDCVGQLKSPEQASVVMILANRKGSLMEVLTVISDSNISIASMDCWPTEDCPEQYHFYLELKWNRSKEDWMRMISLFNNLSIEGGPILSFKDLGIYPVYRV